MGWNFILRGLVFFCCTIHNAIAQYPPDYVKQYYPWINKAEMHIIHGKYQEAIENYQQAFSHVSCPFAVDYFNAVVCAGLAGRKKVAFKYLDQLVLRGVTMSMLKQYHGLRSLTRTAEWLTFEKKYASLRKRFEETFNRTLRRRLDILTENDQYFRRKTGSYEVYGDSIKKADSNNVKAIKAIIGQYGFPGECDIGIYNGLTGKNDFLLIFIHQSSTTRITDFTEALLKAVKEGKLNNHTGAYLMDNHNGDGKYRSGAFLKFECAVANGCENDTAVARYLNRMFYFKTHTIGNEVINKQRSELGLEPLDEYAQKVLFGVNNNDFYFSFDNAVVILKIRGHDDITHLLDKIEFIQ